MNLFKKCGSHCLPLFAFFALACFGEEPKAETKTGSALTAHVYNLPPYFASRADPSNKDGKRKPNPGFIPVAGSETDFDASGFLKDNGVSFPPGSMATYDQSKGQLVVINTPENIEYVEELLGINGDSSMPIMINCELSAIECSLPAEMASPSSERLSYHDLSKLATASMKLLDRVSLSGMSGQRNMINHVIKSATGKSKAKADSDIASPFLSNETGTKVELEPVAGPDLTKIDASIVYQFRYKAGDQISFIKFDTSFFAWEDYPVILHVSPVPNQTGKYIVIVVRMSADNPGGWKLKCERDEKDKSKK